MQRRLGVAVFAGLMLSLAAVPAAADCTTSGNTVTCTSSGGPQTTPVGTGAEDGVTVNIQSGATVDVSGTPNPAAVFLNDGAAVNNAGNVINGDGGVGVDVNNGGTVNNTGNIIVGDGAFGIIACCGNNIMNDGRINVGDGSAAVFVADTNVVVNRGVITAGANGAGITGGDNNVITNVGSITIGGGLGSVGIATMFDSVVVNSGIITMGQDGYGIAVADNAVLPPAGTYSVNNSGSIITGDQGIGIVVTDNHRIINSGNITAGNSAIGISANNSNFITNTGTIGVGDNSAGIQACCNNTVLNYGTITAGSGSSAYGISVADNSSVTNFNVISVGVDASGIYAVGDGGQQTITNSGTISALGGSSAGIFANFNYNVVNTGTIFASSGAGIQVGGGNAVTNAGTINVDAAGVGVSFNAFNDNTANTFTNTGNIFANGAFAIFGDSNNTVTNNGYIRGQVTLAGFSGGNNTLINNGYIVGGDAAGFSTASGVFVAGTLINGPNGTFAVRVSPTFNDGFVAPTVTLNGGTLSAVVTPGLYAGTTVYSQATTFGAPVQICGSGFCTPGGLSGQFGAVTSTSPFFSATALYDYTGNGVTTFGEVDLVLTRLAFGSVPGMTKNQSAVGNALEPGYSSTLDPTSTVGQFYVNMLSATSLSVLDQLSGAGAAAAQDGAFAAGSQFGNIMFQQGMSWLNGTSSGMGVGFSEPLGYASAPRKKLADRPGYDAFAAMTPQQSAPVWRAWTSGFGSRRSIDGQPGTADQTSSTFGGGFGVDRQLTPDLLLGLAAGGSGSNFSVSGLSTSGRINAGHIGAYAAQRLGTAYLAASVNYARSETTTDRTITGVGPTENAKGRFDSDQLSGRIELGRKFGFNGYAVTPFVALEPSALWQNAYTESSTTLGGTPGVLGLRYNANKVTSLPLFLGAQIDASYALAGGQTLSPYARLSWVHEFKPERSIQASFINIPGPTFTVDGARAASDAVRLDMGGSLALSKRAALNLNVTGEFSDRSNSVAALGGLRMNW
ncbi:MAG: autotransporter domain-containing protein [Pseudolabrys sp.]|nr:autotransporter domain-containing protein [Pseudolabrys sp.]